MTYSPLVSVYIESSRITILKHSQPLLPRVCIVNRLLIDVQERITCFGRAGGNYSYTMTCSSEIKFPFEELGIELCVLFLFVPSRSVKGHELKNCFISIR